MYTRRIYVYKIYLHKQLKPRSVFTALKPNSNKVKAPKIQTKILANVCARATQE